MRAFLKPGSTGCDPQSINQHVACRRAAPAMRVGSRSPVFTDGVVPILVGNPPSAGTGPAGDLPFQPVLPRHEPHNS